MKKWQKGYVRVQERRDVPELKLGDLDELQLEAVIDMVRDTLTLWDRGPHTWSKMRAAGKYSRTRAQGRVELTTAARSRRLLMKHHRGQVYVYYSPMGRAGPSGFDDRLFVGRVSKPRTT